MRRLVQAALIAAFGAGVCGTASAEWTRSYVIDWYEPADYFGAKAGASVLDPGTDCPNGSNPEIDWVKVLVKNGYTLEEASWLRNPANPSRSPVHGQNQMAFRGKNRENVYIMPWTEPDPGLVGVTGDLTEGFDLDNNPKTGFASPTGDKGVDNAFYRTMGCTKSYRGPARLSSNALGANDSMREGSWTVAIVVHGSGDDPMNDPNVDVGIYQSSDKLVKAGDGEIARDYTFRIKPSRLEAMFKASTSKGVITSKGSAPEVWMHDSGGTRDLQLLQAKLRLEMKPDGSLQGHIGGYRPWLPIYTTLVNNRGPVVEVLGWIEIPSIWYALKRNADYAPTPGGEKTHISYAMRVSAIPAFVMTPDATKPATSVISYRDKANPADEPPIPLLGNGKPLQGIYRAVDGLVPMAGVPAGKALEIHPVPKEVSAAAQPANGGK